MIYGAYAVLFILVLLSALVLGFLASDVGRILLGF